MKKRKVINNKNVSKATQPDGPAFNRSNKMTKTDYTVYLARADLTEIFPKLKADEDPDHRMQSLAGALRRLIRGRRN